MSGYTIPVSQIVGVTPSVLSAGGAALDMCGLLITTNSRVPIGTVQSYPSQTAIASLFGPGSLEAALASNYFLGFNGSSLTPGNLLVAQYPLTAVGAYLRGGSLGGLSLTALQALSGSLSVTINGTVATSANINLAAATSFSNAASIIQTALAVTGPAGATVTGSIAGTTLTVTAVASGAIAIGQVLAGTSVTAGTTITALGTGTGGTGTYTVSTTQTTASTTITATNPAVYYDSVSGAFVINSGTTGTASTIGFGSGALATGLNLTQALGALISPGAAAATPATFMANILTVTQNWVSFMTAFEPPLATKLQFAAWVNSTDDQYLYAMWDSDTSPTNSSDTESAGYNVTLDGYSGIAPISNTSAVAAFLMGSVASLNFTQLNGRATMAFRSQSGLAPTVTNGTIAANLITNNYNYYGAYGFRNQTDNANFFYPGSVSGPFKWIDSYVNQIWLNNALQLSLVELLLSVYSIPYNAQGYALIVAALQTPINAALNFGAFDVGVTLSPTQIAELNNVGCDTAALQNNGFYVLIGNASAQTRAARSSPPITLWYVDGGSVQSIQLSSIEVQ
jgi:hypothetical protein